MGCDSRMNEILNVASLCITLSKEVKVDLDIVLNKFYDYDALVYLQRRDIINRARGAILHDVLYEQRINGLLKTIIF